MLLCIGPETYCREAVESAQAARAEPFEAQLLEVFGQRWRCASSLWRKSLFGFSCGHDGECFGIAKGTRAARLLERCDLCEIQTPETFRKRAASHLALYFRSRIFYVGSCFDMVRLSCGLCDLEGTYGFVLWRAGTLRIPSLYAQQRHGRVTFPATVSIFTHRRPALRTKCTSQESGWVAGRRGRAPHHGGKRGDLPEVPVRIVTYLYVSLRIQKVSKSIFISSRWGCSGTTGHFHGAGRVVRGHALRRASPATYTPFQSSETWS